MSDRTVARANRARIERQRKDDDIYGAIANVRDLNYDPLGEASAELAAHVADPDPHPTYTTAAELSAAITAAINAVINAAPGTLDTLDELAAALGDDPNFATSIATLLAGKQPLDGTLTALAAANWAANAVPIGTGADALAQTAFAVNTFLARASAGNLGAKPISDYGLSLVNGADAVAVRTLLALAAIASSGSATDLVAGSIPAARIAAGTITNAMQANMAANTMSGNPTAAAAAPADIAVAANQFIARSSAGNLAVKSITDGALAHLAAMVSGTFSPVTVGTVTAGVGTYTKNLGKYTRFSDHYKFKIELTQTAHTGTGNVRISGLPFTSANDSMDNACTVGRVDNLACAAGQYILAAVPANSTQIIIYQQPTGGGVSSGITLDVAFTIVIEGVVWL